MKQKIYISEKHYKAALKEDKQSVDYFKAKLEGVMHHLKPYMEMSDEELDELVHKHQWVDEQMSEIEVIAKNIGHFAEYEWSYFSGEKEKVALNEKKKKRDRCLRIADRKYKKPSAYKSGAVVRCRRGEIWKDLKS